MYKLFAINYESLNRTLKIQFRSVVPISHFHSTNKTLFINSNTEFISEENEDSQPTQYPNGNAQISHPWPEWVELMERLLRNGYFEGIGNPFGNPEMGLKESNQIRTACLNFAREKSDFLRHLSTKDIHVIAGSGCPTIDWKVVNSGKRLRAHVGIDEENVCGSCILRGNCERAYAKSFKDECGRTVDVMRLLLTYGLDPITGTVENMPCLNKTVKESVRRLLKELVKASTKELDSDTPIVPPTKWNSPKEENSFHEGQTNAPMKQGDWICPKCNFLNFARNIKCLRCDGLFPERLKKIQEDQEHLPLKKGDWMCDICNILNFAKNTRCWLCKAKPPKRELNPGEWECDSCNYINFRKNMVCLKCDHRRPKASNSAELYNESYLHPPASMVRELQGGNKDVNRWSFVEGENSKDYDKSWPLDEIPRFVDFPIAGGKSDLSRNVVNQETWKTEMAHRSRNATKAKENAIEFKSAIIQSSKLLESTDDNDEMEEWFGVVKKGI